MAVEQQAGRADEADRRHRRLDADHPRRAAGLAASRRDRRLPPGGRAARGHRTALDPPDRRRHARRSAWWRWSRSAGRAGAARPGATPFEIGTAARHPPVDARLPMARRDSLCQGLERVRLARLRRDRAVSGGAGRSAARIRRRPASRPKGCAGAVVDLYRRLVPLVDELPNELVAAPPRASKIRARSRIWWRRRCRCPGRPPGAAGAGRRRWPSCGGWSSCSSTSWPSASWARRSPPRPASG